RRDRLLADPVHATAAVQPGGDGAVDDRDRRNRDGLRQRRDSSATRLSRDNEQAIAGRAKRLELVVAVHLLHPPARGLEEQLQLEAREPAQLEFDLAAPKITPFVL